MRVCNIQVNGFLELLSLGQIYLVGGDSRQNGRPAKGDESRHSRPIHSITELISIRLLSLFSLLFFLTLVSPSSCSW